MSQSDCEVSSNCGKNQRLSTNETHGILSLDVLHVRASIRILFSSVDDISYKCAKRTSLGKNNTRKQNWYPQAGMYFSVYYIDVEETFRLKRKKSIRFSERKL